METQMNAPIAWRRLLGGGVLAGLLGAALIDLFLYLTTVLPRDGSMLPLWAWIASTVIGEQAFSLPGAPWLGLGLHIGVSLGWAFGFAYLAQRQQALVTRPWTSGIVYGLCVYLGMQLILLADGNFAWPGWSTLAISLIAHAFFYGVPVALVVSATERRARA